MAGELLVQNGSFEKVKVCSVRHDADPGGRAV